MFSSSPVVVSPATASSSPVVVSPATASSSPVVVSPATTQDLDAATELFTAYRDFYRRPFSNASRTATDTLSRNSRTTSTRAFLAKRIANKDSILLLARLGRSAAEEPAGRSCGRPGTSTTLASRNVGLALMYLFLDASTMRVSLLLSDLFVKETVRRCGAASALLYAAEEMAARLECSHAFLRTGVTNTAAQRLYAKAGYVRFFAPPPARIREGGGDYTEDKVEPVLPEEEKIRMFGRSKSSEYYAVWDWSRERQRNFFSGSSSRGGMFKPGSWGEGGFVISRDELIRGQAAVVNQFGPSSATTSFTDRLGVLRTSIGRCLQEHNHNTEKLTGKNDDPETFILAASSTPSFRYFVCFPKAGLVATVCWAFTLTGKPRIYPFWSTCESKPTCPLDESIPLLLELIASLYAETGYVNMRFEAGDHDLASALLPLGAVVQLTEYTYKKYFQRGNRPN